MNTKAMQIAQTEPRLVTLDQASWELRKPYGAISYRVRMGEISARLVDGRVLVDLDEVKHMFENPQRVGVRRKLLKQLHESSQNKVTCSDGNPA
jgi:hypothetical protein